MSSPCAIFKYFFIKAGQTDNSPFHAKRKNVRKIKLALRGTSGVRYVAILGY